MPVKIRLQRHGSKKRPFYFIVVADARSPRDGRFIVFSNQDPKTKYDLWALPMTPGNQGDRTPIPLLTSEFSERTGQVSPDSRWLMSASFDGSIRFWDMVSGKLSHSHTAPADTAYVGAAFSAHGRQIVAAPPRAERRGA